MFGPDGRSAWKQNFSPEFHRRATGPAPEDPASVSCHGSAAVPVLEHSLVLLDFPAGGGRALLSQPALLRRRLVLPGPANREVGVPGAGRVVAWVKRPPAHPGPAEGVSRLDVS